MKHNEKEQQSLIQKSKAEMQNESGNIQVEKQNLAKQFFFRTRKSKTSEGE